MKEYSKINRPTNVLFIIYLIALFWIILFKFNVPFSNLGYMRNVNLIPFSESLIINGKLDLGEIIMNVVIFVPLGIYVGAIFKKWAPMKNLLFILSISLVCEVFQFILGIGASDITDVITNTAGGIIGLIIYKGIEKIFKNSVRTQKFINVIASIGTISAILFLSLLVIYNL